MKVNTEKIFQHWTDEMLVRRWLALDGEVVKSGRNKGCVTIKAAREGDRIMIEARRRGVRLPVEAA
jgi:hypothetical protein